MSAVFVQGTYDVKQASLPDDCKTFRFVCFGVISCHFISFHPLTQLFTHAVVHAFRPDALHSHQLHSNFISFHSFHSCIHSFIRPFVHSFIYSFVRSFIQSSMRSFVHSFHSWIHPSSIPSCISLQFNSVYSFVPFISSSVYPFIRSSILPIVHSFTHSFFQFSSLQYIEFQFVQVRPKLVSFQIISSIHACTHAFIRSVLSFSPQA